MTLRVRAASWHWGPSFYRWRNTILGESSVRATDFIPLLPRAIYFVAPETNGLDYICIRKPWIKVRGQPIRLSRITSIYHTCTLAPLLVLWHSSNMCTRTLRFIRHTLTKPLNIVNRGVTLSLKALLSLDLHWLLADIHRLQTIKGLAKCLKLCTAWHWAISNKSWVVEDMRGNAKTR